MRRKILLAFIFCFLMVGFAQAEAIRISWEHDLPGDLAGFKIYMQSEAVVPGCPENPKEENEIADLPYVPGEPLQTDYQLTGAENETFHFVITAYDNATPDPNESDCSEEATYTMPDLPINAPFSVIIEVVLPTTTTTTP
jgi:hypothetical protein